MTLQAPAAWTHHDVLRRASALALAVTAAASGAAEIEEVVVTAQKRAQSIQDVPISITAFSGDFLEENGLDTIEDVATMTPNFYISSSSQQTNTRITIRGIASAGNNAIEPSVGVFIDGVYYPRPGSVIGQLIDIESFEVLRGPQGTLFGRNTPMGALNITTRSPSFEPEAMIQGGLGNYGAAEIGAMASGGITDAVAGRLTVKYVERDGFADNLYDGKEVGARDDLVLRGKLLWDLSDRLSATITADYAEINAENGAIEVLNSTRNPIFDATSTALYGATPTTADSFDWKINQDHRDQLEDEQSGLALDINYGLGNGSTVRSITAYREWRANVVESALRLPTNLLPRNTEYETTTYSQEVQLLSPGGETVDWVAGAFWYREEYDIYQSFDAGDSFCVPTVAGLAGPGAAALCAAGQQVPITDTVFAQELDSVAVFGQATWNVNDALAITLGGRWTRDEKDGDFVQTLYNPFGSLVRAPEEVLAMTVDDSQFTWFANASWFASEGTMLFATASTGYKSGGFNSEGAASALGSERRVFAPEDTENLELGIKSTLLDGAMTANATLYRTDIVDFQDRAFDGLSFNVVNAGKIRQQGLEADINWSPINALRFVVGIGYLDSEYLEFDGAPGLPGGPVQDLEGERRNFSPEWQTSLAADWTGSLGGNLEWFAGLSYSWIDEQNVGAVSNNNPQTVQDSYGLMNGRLGLRDAGGAWEVTLFGNNLTEEGYCIQMFDQPFGAALGALDPANNTIVQRCVLGDPRTYMARFSYHF
ncbi:MAG: TonB-dependent receptor [Pseudohaliea sp.]